MQVPEYRSLYVFYKNMKKQLNKWPRGDPPLVPEAMQAEEIQFVEALLNQVSTLNTFRIQKQVDSAQALEELRAQEVEARLSIRWEEKQRVYQGLVNFHGETILLLHWSIMAYTAMVKLLKKHRRRTGILVESPRLQELLSQSEWSTDAVTTLIDQAESLISHLQPDIFVDHNPAPPLGGRRGSGDGGSENQVLLNTLASLPDDKAEDSGEDSAGTQDEAAEGQDKDGAASAGSSSYHPLSRAATSAEVPRGAQQPTEASGALHAESDPRAAEAEPVVNHALIQHMEDALRTWEYLGSHASTPSTVVRNNPR